MIKTLASFTLLDWLTYIAGVLLVLALMGKAEAQEPSRAIVPADPVSITARTPNAPVVAHGDDAAAPVLVQPIALPPLKKPLGTVARELRAQHAADPKATTVRNDDQPIDLEDKI